MAPVQVRFAGRGLDDDGRLHEGVQDIEGVCVGHDVVGALGHGLGCPVGLVEGVRGVDILILVLLDVGEQFILLVRPLEEAVDAEFTLGVEPPDDSPAIQALPQRPKVVLVAHTAPA
jgi:hypothetical protein